MAGADAGSILRHPFPRQRLDFAAAVRWVKAVQGRGQIRQALDIAALSLRRGFEPKDYYLLRLFRPELTAEDRRAYLSMKEIVAFNLSLNSPELRTQGPLINDKMLCHILFERCGVPTPRLLAHASAHFRFPEPCTLATPEDILAFWRSPGALPCFGKPVHGSRGMGGASLVSISADGATVTLGDGREVEAQALAWDVLASYPEGYMFQELLRHGPELAALIGPMAATVRIVTVQTTSGPRVLYGLFRMPGPNVMVDSAIAGRVLVALLELPDGRILRAQDLYQVSGRDVAEHPTTGATLPGLVLAQIPEALRIVTEAHGLFADHGILGWDVILTERGPLVTEVNANPLHYAYQRGADCGLLNPGNRALIDEARAFVAARLAASGKGKGRVRGRAA